MVNYYRVNINNSPDTEKYFNTFFLVPNPDRFVFILDQPKLA